jgi:glutamine amidotransferase
LYYPEITGKSSTLKTSTRTTQLIRMKLAHGEKAILVASEPLTEEELLEIPNKRMLVIDRSLRTEVIDLS